MSQSERGGERPPPEPLTDAELHEWRRTAAVVEKIGQQWVVRVADVKRLLDEIDRLRAAASPTPTPARMPLCATCDNRVATADDTLCPTCHAEAQGSSGGPPDYRSDQ
jgi:hypothetical protein